MTIIDLRPCLYCGTLIGLPWLVVDDMTFCRWEHYRLWKNQQLIGKSDYTRRCAHCGKQVTIPWWLIVDGKVFCKLRHYLLWKYKPFVGDDDHAPLNVDRGGFTDDAPQTTENL